MITALLLVILAYLMGSICSAVIVCKMFSLPDPRLEGSKNPGATNVLRIAGKQYAIWVLAVDILKGMVPVLIAKLITINPTTIGFVALAAVLGHMYPVFFNFKGGKGVATAIGALLGFQFIVGVLVAGTWLLVLKIYRYSSLASLVAITLAPFYAILITSNIYVTPPIFLIALLIIIKHSKNIGRLIDGTEPKVEFTQSSALEEIMYEDPINVDPSLEPTQPAKHSTVIVDEITSVEIVEKPKKKKSPATSAAKVSKTPKKTSTTTGEKVKAASTKVSKPAKKPTTKVKKSTPSKE